MVKKGFIGTLVLTAIVCISALMPAVAAEYYIDTFGKINLAPSTHVESSEHYLSKGRHSTTVKFSSLTTEGNYYLGFHQKLGDGTYGGGAGKLAVASKLTMNRMYQFDLNLNYHKEYITGKTAIGTISGVTLSN